MVTEWMVDIEAFSMPNFFSKTSATGTKQLVVQEAIEITLSWAGLNFSSLTPKTKVLIGFSPLLGAVIITNFAPAFKC